ncbi:hypothetical protein BsWGS_06801 [Bradybaena similaris]
MDTIMFCILDIIGLQQSFKRFCVQTGQAKHSINCYLLNVGCGVIVVSTLFLNKMMQLEVIQLEVVQLEVVQHEVVQFEVVQLDMVQLDVVQLQMLQLEVV